MSVAPEFSSVSAVTALTASGTSDKRLVAAGGGDDDVAGVGRLLLGRLVVDRGGFGGRAFGRLGGALVGVGFLRVRPVWPARTALPKAARRTYP